MESEAFSPTFGERLKRWALHLLRLYPDDVFGSGRKPTGNELLDVMHGYSAYTIDGEDGAWWLARRDRGIWKELAVASSVEELELKAAVFGVRPNVGSLRYFQTFRFMDVFPLGDVLPDGFELEGHSELSSSALAYRGKVVKVFDCRDEEESFVSAVGWRKGKRRLTWRDLFGWTTYRLEAGE